MLSGFGQCAAGYPEKESEVKGESGSMKLRFNKTVLSYKIVLVIILVVEMHYFSLFTLPENLDFIVYQNRAKWVAPIAMIMAWFCYRNHKSALRKYIRFLKKYFAVVCISLILISVYTTIVYPLNPLITTYGFACYYLYAFLVIPLLYICSVEGGYERLFDLVNVFAVIMYIVTILQGVSYIRTGNLLFAAASSDIGIRDGKVRFFSGPFGFLMLIYNFYRLYNLREERIRKRLNAVISVALGVLSIYFTGNSRVFLATLLASIGVLVLLGDGSSKKKLITIASVIAAVVVLFTGGIISEFLGSFSSSGDLAGSTIARVEATKYYLGTFLKNPLFAIGFAGDKNYYDIVHGASGLHFQSVYVRYFYEDVGIVGQIALLGSFVIGIYIWPLFRIIKIGFICSKSKQILDGRLVMAMACYLICTTPTLIITNEGNVIAFPFILVIVEYIYAKFKEENGIRGQPLTEAS